MNPNDVPGAQASSFASPTEIPTVPLELSENAQNNSSLEQVMATSTPELAQAPAPENKSQSAVDTLPPPIDLVPEPPIRAVTVPEVPQENGNGIVPTEPKPVRPVRSLNQLDTRTQDPRNWSEAGAGLEFFVGSARKGAK